MADLDRIEEYIQQESPSSAERIWVRIYDRVGRQAEMPFAAPLHREGPARKLVVSGTPYIVLYLIDGDIMRIEQVLHMAQNA